MIYLSVILDIVNFGIETHKEKIIGTMNLTKSPWYAYDLGVYLWNSVVGIERISGTKSFLSERCLCEDQ